MAEIVLVRQEDMAVTEADKDAARRVLFGMVDGLGEINRRKWRRFMATLFRMEPGEMATIKTHKARSGPFHRRHMALEQRVFDAQERFTDFERGFRDWLKVGAGFVDLLPGRDGVPVAIPRSIAWHSLDEQEFIEFTRAMNDFLATSYAQAVLWPHLLPSARHRMLEFSR